MIEVSNNHGDKNLLEDIKIVKEIINEKKNDDNYSDYISRINNFEYNIKLFTSGDNIKDIQKKLDEEKEKFYIFLRELNKDADYQSKIKEKTSSSLLESLKSYHYIDTSDYLQNLIDLGNKLTYGRVDSLDEAVNYIKKTKTLYSTNGKACKEASSTLDFESYIAKKNNESGITCFIIKGVAEFYASSMKRSIEGIGEGIVVKVKSKNLEFTGLIFDGGNILDLENNIRYVSGKDEIIGPFTNGFYRNNVIAMMNGADLTVTPVDKNGNLELQSVLMK